MIIQCASECCCFFMPVCVSLHGAVLFLQHNFLCDICIRSAVKHLFIFMPVNVQFRWHRCGRHGSLLKQWCQRVQQTTCKLRCYIDSIVAVVQQLRITKTIEAGLPMEPLISPRLNTRGYLICYRIKVSNLCHSCWQAIQFEPAVF